MAYLTTVCIFFLIHSLEAFYIPSLLSETGFSKVQNKELFLEEDSQGTQSKSALLASQDDQLEVDDDDNEVLNILARAGLSPARRKERLKTGRGIFPKTLEKMKTQIRQRSQALLIPVDYLAEEHHLQYGSPWANGRADVQMLRRLGLKANHTLLEIACGSLRSGIHYIKYLNNGNYFCIEKDEYSLRAGIEYELPLHDLMHKRPSFAWNANFSLPTFEQPPKFDFVTAMAVFIHLTREEQMVALGKISNYLTEGGLFVVSHAPPLTVTSTNRALYPKEQARKGALPGIDVLDLEDFLNTWKLKYKETVHVYPFWSRNRGMQSFVFEKVNETPTDSTTSERFVWH